MDSEDVLNEDQILESGENEAIDDDLTGVDVDGLLGDDDQSMNAQVEEYQEAADGTETEAYEEGDFAGEMNEDYEYNGEVQEDNVEEADPNNGNNVNPMEAAAGEEANEEESSSEEIMTSGPSVCSFQHFSINTVWFF